MTKFITDHNRAFSAELIKLKRAGMFWLCIGFAGFTPVLNTIIAFVFPIVSKETAWSQILEMSFAGFTSFFFPLFLIISVVRLVYLEHRSDTWKLMETQPVSKAALFIAKYEIALLLSLIVLVIVLLFALIGGLILAIAKPSMGFRESTIDWSLQTSVIARFWIGSFGLMAVQYFLSLLMRSFAWPLIIGLVALMAASILVAFNVMNWFPYSSSLLTAKSMSGSKTGALLLQHEIISILWMLLALRLGYQFFAGKTFTNSFFPSLTRSAITIALFALFVVTTAWINSPVQLRGYLKTVLAGKLTTDKRVDRIYLFNEVNADTVLYADVKNGVFHATTNKPVKKGIYLLKIGSQVTPVYFGSNDSLHIIFKNKKGRHEQEFGGTLIAENEFLSEPRNNFSQLQNYAYEFNPSEYGMMLMEQWDDGNETIDRFKTLDKIKPSDEFIRLQKKLLAIKLLRLLELKYPQTFAIYNPNATLKYPRIVNRLKKELNLNDSTLAGYSDYNSFVSDYVQAKAKPLNDSMFFAAIRDSVSSTPVREAVLFAAAREKINTKRDSVQRLKLLQATASLVKELSYIKLLQQQVNQLNKIMRGRPAPVFSAESLNGSVFHLSQLRGRYVVVDVWATWCGPCKRESPLFEEYAERYTSENVAFVALSIDEEKAEWKYDAANKNGMMLQLWANNRNEFAQAYALSTIPRFMLIDPRGNIISTQLPPPSDPEFEVILEREMKAVVRPGRSF